MSKRWVGVALGALAVLAAGCGGSGRPSGQSMKAVDFAFEPELVAVTAGQQVTIKITNAGEVRHNLSAPGIEADVDYEPGQSTNFIFVAPAEPGRLEFFCKYHRDQGMAGAFLVRP